MDREDVMAMTVPDPSAATLSNLAIGRFVSSLFRVFVLMAPHILPFMRRSLFAAGNRSMAYRSMVRGICR